MGNALLYSVTNIFEAFIGGYLINIAQVSVLWFVLVWFLAGTAFGTAWCAASGSLKLKPVQQLYHQYPRLLILYLLSSVAAPFIIMTAVSLEGVGDVAVLTQMGILISLFWGIFYLKESFTKLDIVYALLIGAGIFIFSGSGSVQIGLALLLILIGETAYRVQEIAKKHFGKDLDVMLLITVRSWTILVVAVALAWWFQINLNLPWQLYVICAVGGVFGVVIHRYFAFKALQQIDLSHFVLFSKVNMVILFGLSVLLLDETFTTAKAVGGALVLLGVMAFSVKRSKKTVV